MAIYHLQTKPVSRRSGRSSVAAAAYRSADRLVDATGVVHDYRRRSGVVSATVLMPHGESVSRQDLWTGAEAAERRSNSRTAREWEIALPAELDASQRQELALSFGRELVTRYGVAVDVAVHTPTKGGDERNHHAHLLATTRTVRVVEGELVYGSKSTIEWSETDRRKAKLGRGRDEVSTMRERWAEQANAALERAGEEARIDPRTLEAQGVDRVPQIHLGPHVTAMERRGESTSRGARAAEIDEANTRRASLGKDLAENTATLRTLVQSYRPRLEDLDRRLHQVGSSALVPARQSQLEDLTQRLARLAQAAEQAAAQEAAQRKAFEEARQAEARQEALVEAVKQSNVEEMKRLVEAGADPQDRDERDQTLLHVAALGDASPEMTAALVAQGIEVNARNSSDQTALHLAAARSTQAEVIGVYLTVGADRQAQTPAGLRPAHFAARYTQAASVLETLVEGETVNGRNPKGQTLLHYAGGNPRPEAAQVLLQQKWNPEARDGQGWTPLGIAQAKGNLETAAVLAAAMQEALGEAVTQNDVPAMQRLVAAGADPQPREEPGSTLLHVAAEHDASPEMVQALLDQGLRVDTQTQEGVTALHLAARWSTQAEVIRLLTPSGDVTARRDEGETPLEMVVSRSSSAAVVTALVEGETVDGRDPQDQTLLHHAARNPNPAAAQALLEKKWNPEVHDRQGRTPLEIAQAQGHAETAAVLTQEVQRRVAERHQEQEAEQARQAQARQEALVEAVKQSNVKEMQSLVEAGADLQQCDEQGQTLLHVAALHDASPAMTGALLAEGIEVNARTSQGETALHLAASRSTQAAVLEAYLAAGADRQAECQGWRPVEVAAGYTREAAVLEVLVQGEDLDGRDGQGRTLLHHAARNPNPAAAQVLRKDWDLAARDGQGQTPLEIAQAQGNSKTVAVLTKGILQQELRATRERVAGLASLFAKLEALWSQGVTKIQNYRKEAQVQAEREAADLARQEVVAAPPEPPPAPEVPAEPPVEPPAAADVDPVPAIIDWARACSEQCGQLQDEKRRTRLQDLDTDLRLTRERLIDLEQSPPGFFRGKAAAAAWKKQKETLLSEQEKLEGKREQVRCGSLAPEDLQALEQQAQAETKEARPDLWQAFEVASSRVAAACQRVEKDLDTPADRDFLDQLHQDLTPSPPIQALVLEESPTTLQGVVLAEVARREAYRMEAVNEYQPEYHTHQQDLEKLKERGPRAPQADPVAWSAKNRRLEIRGKVLETTAEELKNLKKFKDPGQAGTKAVQERVKQLIPRLSPARHRIRQRERDQERQTRKATQHKSQGQGHKL